MSVSTRDENAKNNGIAPDWGPWMEPFDVILTRTIISPAPAEIINLARYYYYCCSSNLGNWSSSLCLFYHGSRTMMIVMVGQLFAAVEVSSLNQYPQSTSSPLSTITRTIKPPQIN
jgi:hypothetical protein